MEHKIIGLHNLPKMIREAELPPRLIVRLIASCPDETERCRAALDIAHILIHVLESCANSSEHGSDRLKTFEQLYCKYMKAPMNPDTFAATKKYLWRELPDDLRIFELGMFLIGQPKPTDILDGMDTFFCIFEDEYPHYREDKKTSADIFLAAFYLKSAEFFEHLVTEGIVTEPTKEQEEQIKKELSGFIEKVKGLNPDEVAELFNKSESLADVKAKFDC